MGTVAIYEITFSREVVMKKKNDKGEVDGEKKGVNRSKVSIAVDTGEELLRKPAPFSKITAAFEKAVVDADKELLQDNEDIISIDRNNLIEGVQLNAVGQLY